MGLGNLIMDYEEERERLYSECLSDCLYILDNFDSFFPADKYSEQERKIYENHFKSIVSNHPSCSDEDWEFLCKLKDNQEVKDFVRQTAEMRLDVL